MHKKKALSRLLFIGVGIVVLGGGYWYIERSFTLPFQQIASFEYSATTKIENNFSAPPPLQQISGGSLSNSNTLTQAGVIQKTNQARSQNGNLPALSESPTLDAIAMLRLDDMFGRSIFCACKSCHELKR